MVSFSVTEMLSQASMALVPIRMYSLETVQEFKPLGHPQFWLNINRFSTYWKYVLSKNFLCTRKFILHFGEFYVSFLEWGYTNSIFVGTFICTLMKYFIENVLQIWHDLAKNLCSSRVIASIENWKIIRKNLIKPICFNFNKDWPFHLRILGVEK